MISTQLNQLAQKHSWQTHSAEDLVYGLSNGYRFSLFEGLGFKAIVTPIAGISPENLILLKEWLSANQKPQKFKNFELADNFLLIRVKEAWKPRTVEQIEWILDQLSGLFDQFNLPKNACVICGEESLTQGLLHGLFCALHPECQDAETVDFTLA